jgi:hypothetical protein
LRRLTGTVLLAETKLDEAQASLEHVIRIAQAQQAKSLELRTPPAISPGCGATKAGGAPKAANCSQWFTAVYRGVQHRRT